MGNVDYNDLEFILKSSNSKTLVSLMHINNELGNILDINLVSNLCNQYESLFHSDTVQTVGHYKLDLSSLNIDFLVASAHKFHGPKGIGFAYINKKNPIKPLIFGGSQEKGCRAGTESVHNIVGMSEALDISIDKIDAETEYIKNLKSYFIDQLKDNIRTTDIDELTAEQCASMGSVHPDYTKLASAITISNLHKNTIDSFYETMKKMYEFIDVNNNNYKLIHTDVMKAVEENKEELDLSLIHI